MAKIGGQFNFVSLSTLGNICKKKKSSCKESDQDIFLTVVLCSSLSDCILVLLKVGKFIPMFKSPFDMDRIKREGGMP